MFYSQSRTRFLMAGLFHLIVRLYRRECRCNWRECRWPRWSRGLKEGIQWRRWCQIALAVRSISDSRSSTRNRWWLSLGTRLSGSHCGQVSLLPWLWRLCQGWLSGRDRKSKEWTGCEWSWRGRLDRRGEGKSPAGWRCTRGGKCSSMGWRRRSRMTLSLPHLWFYSWYPLYSGRNYCSTPNSNCNNQPHY